MAKPLTTRSCARTSLDRLSHKSLYRSLAFWMATTSSVGVAMVGNVAVAAPPSANLPAPNTSAISVNQIGASGPDQSGQTGGNADSVSYELSSGQIVGGNNGNPSIQLSSVGGTGGTGSDGGAPTGAGGDGGTASQVTLTLDAGSGVNSSVTNSSANPNAAIWLASTGGNGAAPGATLLSQGYPGRPGAGANSGGITFNQYATVISHVGWNGSTPGTTAILLTSTGGNAGEPLPQDGASGPGTVTGAAGNVAGNGGAIQYNLYQGDVSSQGSAIVALSQGGQGGDGTIAYSDIGKGIGGDGGAGGQGGQVDLVIGQATNATTPNITAVGAAAPATGATIPIDANGDVAQASVMAAGIQAQSVGGLGGAGGTGDGTEGKAGSGGAAGSASNVTVNLNNANISTTGFAAAGVLVQSIGGAGGNGGGAGGIFSKHSGNGAAGGAAGAVTVTLGDAANTSWPSDLISTGGDDSMGIVAQSIGGGGGAGGSVSGGSIGGGVAIGGDGESGGASNVVTLNNGLLASGSNPAQAGFIVSTQGEHSSGLVAQSIGGGGGSGGSANNTVLGAFSYTVGGSGGSGGNAGTPGTTQVSLENLGIISTSGDHAKGVVAQAVGGGGGDGGSAQTVSLSDELNVDVTVGGTGGKSGSAGDVTATNSGEILTSGADAWGLLAQSVSDGGGNGGMSKSDAFMLPGASEVPSLEINASIGGNGGDGSASGNVTADNTQVIMTAGAGAHGILAQSIAGGGGNGGDSSAMTIGSGIGQGTNVTVSVALGGQGGEGGTAGKVTVDNSANALIWTLGDSADGIFAQSVGGGGGSGGTGKNDTYFLGKKPTAGGTFSLKLGGDGGKGSTGGNVIVTNEGNILTIGDSSNGIFAQSVGGGGGLGTGGTAKGSNGNLKEILTLAGSSGAAGNGGTVNATNNATIATFGGDAAGIYAQSVGGGGGKAGTGSTAGLPDANVSLANYLASSTALKGKVATYAGVQAWGPEGWYLSSLSEMDGWAQDYLTYAAAHPANTPADATGANVDVQMFLGGGSDGDSNGGSATQGNGGQVTATNNFSIQTSGPASPGIFAQSVGAGGGESGAAPVNQLQATTGNTFSAKMTVGGKSANVGDGGAAIANNSGNIATSGDASFGIFAQSIGGGGGESIMTASNYALSGGTPIQINLGGAVGTIGNGGAVTVNNNSGSLTASIDTSGNDAVGIVAQSVGGGGGNVMVMQTKATAAGLSSGSTNPLADPSGSLNSVTVGSNTGPTEKNPGKICTAVPGGYWFDSCGGGGTVTVNTSAGSSVSTSGLNAYGVLAQSIGGGGGWIVGLSEKDSSPFNQPVMAGIGGNIDLTLGGTISTSGDGAYGVLAQSIGGGGILGGNLASATTPELFPHDFFGDGNATRDGAGGNIVITNSGSIITTGKNAHAIFAQSVGGGGGLWATTGGNVFMGSVGGEGDAGSINISNSGTVQAKGQGASAIYVNAQGADNHSLVAINNGSTGVIWGNSSAPAIMLTGGNKNGDGNVVNSGFIANTNGTAVSAPNGFATVTNNAGAQLYGNVELGSSGSLTNNGYWGTNDHSTGTVTNAGTLDIYGANYNSIATSTLNGSLTNSGTIQTSIDFYNKQASSLNVLGTVTLAAGTSFYIRPTLLAPNAVTVINSNALSMPSGASATDTGGNYLFNYTMAISNEQALSFQARSNGFNTVATKAGGNSNELGVATQLDQTWLGNNFSASQAKVYAGLSQLSSGTQYLNALDNLSNEGTQAASVAHVVASNAFVERMNSCPRFEDGAQFQSEHDCMWGRVIANDGDRDASGESVGYHQNGQVFQVGGQKEVAQDWFVGGSVSADNSDLDTRTVSSSVDGHGWTAGIVVKHQMGNWLVSTALEGGEMSYDSTRQAQLPGMGGTAQASFNVSHWGLHSRISKQFAFQNWYLKPYVDLHATHIQSDGYTEHGAGALDLTAAPSSTNVFGASPMLEAGSKFAFDNGMTLQIYGGVGGTFYSQGNLGADMQFADSSSNAGWFHITSDLPQDRFKTTAGMDWKASEQWDFRLEYSSEFADHFQSSTGSIKATYKF